MTRLLFCCLLFVAGAQAIAAFPTEDEVRSTLKPGMTPEEVVTLYGTPGGASSSDPTARVITYLSPIGLRTREVEGYVGFKVTFRNGRLVDWQPINTKPSYDPDPPAREHLIPVAWYYGLLFLAVFGYGVFKAFGFANREHRRIIEAFKERTIATRSLPPDFRFIDNETTVREVIDRLGPFTRKTQRLINRPSRRLPHHRH